MPLSITGVIHRPLTCDSCATLAIQSANMSDDPKNMEALSLANHDFSLSLYKELSQNATGNIFYSPFSIHVIMFMASVGAASKTFDEMIATIHLNKTTHSLKTYKHLLEDLTADNDNLKLATGMFVDSSFNLKESFVKKSRNYLKSSMDKLNFKNEPETQRQFLNNWVSSKTNNKINDLFPQDSIDSSTALVLANAVHFKCGWANEFKDAVDEPFYLTPNNQVTIKMMSLKKNLNYYYDDQLQFAALQLPYKDHAYSMIILLPDAKDGLKNLENNLSKIKLDEITNKMRDYVVSVKLPRFKIEHSLELKETLSNLGCPTMFTKDANFSNMVEDENVCVSKVVHKAYIDVDEQGTEAAAATGMPIRKTCSLRANEHKDFVVNHPFIFFICTKNDSIIFVGRMAKIDSLVTNFIKEEL